MAIALGDLCMLLQRKGNNDAAEPLLHESMDLWQRVPGYESFVAYDVAAIAQALWQIHERRGDKAGALPFVRQYLIIQSAHISMGLAASPNDTSFLRSRAYLAAELGRFPQFIADTDKLISRNLDQSTESRVPLESRATTVLFRAMARFRLHQQDEAQRDLDRGHDMLKRIPGPGADVIEFATTIQDWLICQIARREAEGLIAGTTSVPTTR